MVVNQVKNKTFFNKQCFKSFEKFQNFLNDGVGGMIPIPSQQQIMDAWKQLQKMQEMLLKHE